jgi:hypothetical protein
MYQIHCPNCNSNRVDVTGKEIWLMLGIVLGVPGLILLFFTVRHHTTLLFIGLPLCLFALVNIYRFAYEKKAKCVCRKCDHKFVYNFR